MLQQLLKKNSKRPETTVLLTQINLFGNAPEGLKFRTKTIDPPRFSYFRFAY